MNNTKERTRTMDILILIITILIIINLIGDKFINGFKESQAKSYITSANGLVEKAKTAKAKEISVMEDNSFLVVSVCDISKDTSPFNNSKYVCDYSYVVISKSLGQIVYSIQLLDEKGNALPYNYKTLLSYKQIIYNASKKDLKSISEVNVN